MFPLASPFRAPSLELAGRRFIRLPTTPPRRGVTSFGRGARVDEARADEALLAPLPPRMDPPVAYFDAHCHLQLAGAATAAHALRSLGEGERVALMSVEPSCWPAVAALKRRGPRHAVACYGIHPWFAHRAGRRRASPAARGFGSSGVGGSGAGAGAGGDGSGGEDLPRGVGGSGHGAAGSGAGAADAVDDSSWLAELERRLVADPSSGVGEIGLDRAWVPPDHGGTVAWDDQVRVFRQQLRLAARLGRPASLHSVRCPGFLFDELQHAPALPPAVYLHSYTGSAAMVRSLTQLPKGRGAAVYFGFSHAVNGRAALRNRAKAVAVVAAVPADRLLLESDQGDAAARPGNLAQALALLAEARGWTHADTLARTRENAERFYATALS